jgi:hypothetical protein
MGLHGARAEVEALGGLGVGQPRRDQAQHFGFPLAQGRRAAPIGPREALAVSPRRPPRRPSPPPRRRPVQSEAPVRPPRRGERALAQVLLSAPRRRGSGSESRAWGRCLCISRSRAATPVTRPAASWVPASPRPGLPAPGTSSPTPQASPSSLVGVEGPRCSSIGPAAGSSSSWAIWARVGERPASLA